MSVRLEVTGTDYSDVSVNNGQTNKVEIDVKETDPVKAKGIVEDMCKKLLANLVIENYKIIETQ